MSATSKKSTHIGVIAALSILVGSVVGIGIFFKNNTVARAVNHDGLGWMFAWIIGGLVSIATAVCYGEIGRLKTGSVTGLGSWSQAAFGKRFGHFVSITFTTVYLGIDTIVLGFFTSEFFFSFLNVDIPNSYSVWAHLTVGLVFVLILLTVKRFSIKASGVIQSVTTILKLLPLIVAVFIGFIVRGFNLAGPEVKNAFVEGAGVSDSGATRFFSIFTALPAVLFAYDAFLNVASITNKVKNGEKRVPYVILGGMAFIVVIYTLIAVSSIVTDTVFVDGIVALSVAPGTTQNVLKGIVACLIFVSALGVTNGMVTVLNRSIQNLYNAGGLFGSPKLKARYGERGALVYILGLTLFYYLFLLVVSAPFQSDVFVDGVSNFPTFIFFSIYGLVIIGYTLKRERYNTNKYPKAFYYVNAVISVVGILITTAFYFVNNIKTMVESDVAREGWGGTEDNGFTFPAYLPIILLCVFVGYMFLLDFLNRYLAKKYEGRDVVEIVEKAS